MMSLHVKPFDAQWTDDQWKAIYTEGRDILVAAAAGSGKTAVLVERIIQKIMRNKQDVNKLLVVTFTNASAREMKARVNAAIQQESLKHPEDEHLKSQRIKIHQAQISTLHSFCLSLIKSHYDEIDIDPNFRTANEVEGIVLLEQAIDDVLEMYYEKNEQPFLDIVEHLSNDRSDEPLRDTLKRLYRFSIAHANPIAWLDHLDKPYKEIDIKHPYFNMLNQLINRKLDSAMHALYQSLDCYQHLNDVDKHMTYLEGEKIWIEQVINGTKSLDNLHLDVALKKLPTNTAKIKSQNEGDEQLLELGKNYHKDYIDHLKALSEGYLSRDREELVQDMHEMHPRVRVIADITKDIIKYFKSLKQNKRIIDFSDYEHLALEILTDDEGKPSEIARQYRELFDEILVDEYQDTNRVQEAIITCIKRGEEYNGNLFMVGDVKQSIYKFRQAEPELFIEKYKRFNQAKHESGEVIDLSKNFRSRREVLDNTNYIFSHMMDETVGEIEYNDEAKLYYGADYDEKNTPLEMDILVQDSFEEEDNNLIEAKCIVDKVQHILDNKQVYDRKTQSYRPATFKDIVILERSYSNAMHLQQQFKDANIPFYVESKKGYFEQNEIRLMLSFLRVIDNPLQDKYLVGLMRSIAFQFKEDELAEIRNKAPQEIYYFDSIYKYIADSEADTQLVEKLNNFLKQLKSYQSYSKAVPVWQLLDKLYNDYYLISYFSGLTGGVQRRQNLYGLLNKAIQFEASSLRGIFQFIRFIDELIERGQDFGQESVIGPNDDVVRMMTIHSSKGLEFPFVIYSGITREFNRADLRNHVILNNRYGMALSYFNIDKALTYPTLASIIFKNINETEMISEEMRLIYVALTRAKEGLYLVGRVKNEKAVENLGLVNADKFEMIDPEYRVKAKSAFDLISTILSKSKSHGLSNAMTFNSTQNESFNINIIREEESNEEDDVLNDKPTIETLLNYKPSDKKDEIYNQMVYSYPNESLLNIAAKQSVSEIKRQRETEEAGTDYQIVRQYQLGTKSYDKPKFLSNQKRQSAEIGTLMHAVMQHLPLKSGGLNIDQLKDLVNELIEKDILPDDTLDDIDLSLIQGFIQSDLYTRLVNADKVFREVPFVVGQDDIDQGLTFNVSEDDNKPIIQGMIDCIFVEGDKVSFIDYKTDTFIVRRGKTEEEVAETMKQKYEVQMQYYKNTLETILQQPVEGYLYFFQYGTKHIKENN
ncbi:helicase-exonuclease AddAB subunit AddA [Mammaliicoccus fleurettii]|uniref:ATP-dependent helicase/nuclease subunit A n=1 Tax=Mammaliicoccus fleurettii TaxID=150056 RepID=A0ABS5MK17_9STAP|nr:helicase-exonuclease AddAB subunit AddA [Mammaliicoccus fleurettii]MBS3671584.1 helicase-exonuclease AddAB subunit AddA [Mammaliicoccus fleurettii]MBS3696265.1 helicase-exonuclease AddAB subunit AddA [Mammaliicoccus fleurettii]